MSIERLTRDAVDAAGAEAAGSDGAVEEPDFEQVVGDRRASGPEQKDVSSAASGAMRVDRRCACLEESKGGRGGADRR